MRGSGNLIAHCIYGAPQGRLGTQTPNSTAIEKQQAILLSNEIGLNNLQKPKLMCL